MREVISVPFESRSEEADDNVDVVADAAPDASEMKFRTSGACQCVIRSERQSSGRWWCASRAERAAGTYVRDGKKVGRKRTLPLWIRQKI